MNILAIDTASNICSVAIGTENGIIFEKDVSKGLTHSELLMPMIDEAIVAAKIDKKKIERVIVASGPGSFTGLRIGVTVANTFGQVLGIPVIGVTTLDSLAVGIDKTNENICTIIDAKGGKLYIALYKNEDKLSKLSDYDLIDITELKDYINNNTKGKIIFTGDGILFYKDYILENLKDIEYRFIEEEKSFQKASNLIKYVLENKEMLETKSSYVDPMYIKKSQADIR